MNLTEVGSTESQGLYRDMYSRVGFDYEEVENQAHANAVDRLAFDGDGKLLPYMVKMSCFAADIDRKSDVLEFHKFGGRLDLRTKIQADVIVFSSAEQKLVFEEEGYLAFKKH